MGLLEDTKKRLGPGALDQKSQENKQYKDAEAVSAGTTYQDAENAPPVRRVHSGKFDLPGAVEQLTETGKNVGILRDKSKKALEEY
jgi:hypothetical protein